MLDDLTISLDTLAAWAGYPKLHQSMGATAIRNRVIAHQMAKLYPDGLCSYCGCKPAKMTSDHVRPRSKHPGDSYENLVPACGPCNRDKSDKSLLMFLWGRAA
jgi:5-methylcytosine-specific restriction endonuclease McrA